MIAEVLNFKPYLLAASWDICPCCPCLLHRQDIPPTCATKWNTHHWPLARNVTHEDTHLQER